MEDYIYISSESGDDCYASDEDMESLDGIENEDPESMVASSKTSVCKVITRGSLLAAQKEDLQRVMELLSVREHHARTLLIHYRWDIEKLLAVYVEKGRQCLFSEASINVVNSFDLNTMVSTSNMTCEICMDDVLVKDATTMDCGHCFCNNCWTEHFIVKIDEGQSKRIRCMMHKCNTICDEDVVRKLVRQRERAKSDKFDRFLLESYIEDNKMVKWCPSVPHCGNAIRVESDEPCEVECSCGMQFCFGCLSEAHSPCSCFMWELWEKKCRDESETVNWITVHTKLCPKCYKPVEKNGGCNLVRCVCGQPFCWLCGGATGTAHTYNSIANHSCGRFKEETLKRAKLDLQRYMHYHNRYKAHMDSLKKEATLKKTITRKVSYLEDKDPTLRDFSWVTDGIYRLFRSRRALSYSYPFAFYMFGDELFSGEMSLEEREIKKNLFEDQQQHLELNVEKLSKFLEEPFDQYDENQIKEVKMQVLNLSVLIGSLCKKMYECIQNDLLGSLQCTLHLIAPYHSKGVEKAKELSVVCTTEANNSSRCHEPVDHLTGIGDESTASSALGDSPPATRNKRHRKNKYVAESSSSSGRPLFDLNWPAHIGNGKS